MTHRRSPRRLSLALDRAHADWVPQTLLAELQTAWPGVVGEAIAASAVPSAERAGTVTISCQAAVWAQELALMGPSIVDRLNAVLRSGQVTRIRCVTTPLRDDLERRR